MEQFLPIFYLRLTKDGEKSPSRFKNFLLLRIWKLIADTKESLQNVFFAKSLKT